MAKDSMQKQGSVDSQKSVHLPGWKASLQSLAVSTTHCGEGFILTQIQGFAHPLAVSTEKVFLEAANSQSNLWQFLLYML